MLKKVPKETCWAVVLMAVAMLWGLGCRPALAKSYGINQLEITAQIQQDGSMEVTESRTYSFQGPFSFAYRYLPVTAPVSYGDFRISEGGRPYRLDDSEEPGTYTITRSSDRTTVTWYYRAEDESRTFDFRYRASDAITRYRDAAVLYFKFLAEDWDIPHSNIKVTVIPPHRVPKDMVNEWVHGPLWARSFIKDGGTVVILCEHLPRHTYLEIRALYPSEAFPQIKSREESVRSQIMVEEAAWAEEANRQREYAAEQLAARAKRMETGKWIVIGISVIGLALWAWVFAAFRRKPKVRRLATVTSEIPEQTPPALLDYLLNSRRISVGGLVGTMLDLARRGFVKLREERVEKKKIFGGTKLESEYHWDLDRTYCSEHSSELVDYEVDLLAFIFDVLAEGGASISLDTLKKKRREFAGFFRTWTKQVKVHARQRAWFNRRSIRGSYYSLALGITMMALAILMAYLFGLWGIALLVAGGTVLVLSFLIPQRTEAGEAMAKQWEAVRKYLKKYEFRSADRSDLLAQISDYLVYGVVLGLSNKIYEELAGYMPEGEQTRFVPWYIYAGAGRGGFSPAAFGQAFSSMVATATSSMSTAAGTGGGASAGGGGGASSGGGGAG